MTRRERLGFRPSVGAQAHFDMGSQLLDAMGEIRLQDFGKTGAKEICFYALSML